MASVKNHDLPRIQATMYAKERCLENFIQYRNLHNLLESSGGRRNSAYSHAIYSDQPAEKEPKHQQSLELPRKQCGVTAEKAEILSRSKCFAKFQLS